MSGIITTGESSEIQKAVSRDDVTNQGIYTTNSDNSVNHKVTGLTKILPTSNCIYLKLNQEYMALQQKL